MTNFKKEKFSDKTRKNYSEKAPKRNSGKENKKYEGSAEKKESFNKEKKYSGKSGNRYSDKPEQKYLKKSDRTNTDESKKGDFNYSEEKSTARPGKRYPDKRGSRISDKAGKKFFGRDDKKYSGKSGFKKSFSKYASEDNQIRLNKYISNAGICSRREADRLIESGVVRVNGKVVSELGYKVAPTDKVQVDNQTLKPEKKYYVLLNKPKGFITTTSDPYERKTVMSLVKDACKERIYPVGRLDRHTTGLLLFTNDGELSKKLTHPSHNIRKIYHVMLDKNFTKADFDQITGGVKLEDGFIKPDKLAYVDGAEKNNELGVELHSGKNRIVRRMFEELGYKVTKLDRVSFAGLTKKDIPRGKWRYLNDKEISYLRMLK